MTLAAHRHTNPTRKRGRIAARVGGAPSLARRVSVAMARRVSMERAAFSLLEVVVALAILAAALTACLGVVQLGIRSAREARDQSRAQEICESVMGLLSSGVLDINGV